MIIQFLSSFTLLLCFAFMLGLSGYDHILELVENVNVFVAFDHSKNSTIESLKYLYENETIAFGFMSRAQVSLTVSPSNNTDIHFALYLKKEKGIKCLLSSGLQNTPKAIPFVAESQNFLDIVKFINEQCFYFVEADGRINKVGSFRKHIINHLTSVRKVQDTCEHIDATISQEKFIGQYLIKGKPVVIKKAISNWKAMSKWTSGFLRETYGAQDVHIKLTDNGEFEGCDKAEKFLNYATFVIPDEVKRNLKYSDLVVVRPAVANLLFSKFLDMIENVNGTFPNISAYLEYSSIRENFKNLEKDIDDINVVKNILELRHLNIWLSNGKTLGKLHFDPYDNFLCQLRGEKHVTLFDPHENENLYEGHIQEAILSYDWETNTFRNEKLLDSTSMVMSPVDIKNPDLVRFPNFGNAKPLKCILREGDALYMPSFWWHEVQSKPNDIENRNLAVNFWYEPFYIKEFPCGDCKLDVNRFYIKLLSKLSKDFGQ